MCKYQSHNIYSVISHQKEKKKEKEKSFSQR